MSTSISIGSADEAALSAMLGHHSQLRRDLEERVITLREAVATGVSHDEPLARLLEFINGSILPHAIAEEEALYPAASELSRVELLIDGMVLEHRDLERRARALTVTTEGVDALVLAAGFSAVFGVHVAKENDVLLPAILEASTASLATLLRDMEARLAEPSDHMHRHSGDTSAVLDVRTIAHGNRHEIIFGRLHALYPGECLVIVADHDPKPLRYQLDAAWPETFGWEYLDAGPQEWRIAITKLR